VRQQFGGRRPGRRPVGRAVGGAIAGAAIDSIGGGSQRGIDVTVQKDDGQMVVVAQADNGDVQMGDRVRIVQDRNGVASAIRDSGHRRDV
jgi:outer membrane lipoprotein SlyB